MTNLIFQSLVLCCILCRFNQIYAQNHKQTDREYKITTFLGDSYKIAKMITSSIPMEDNSLEEGVYCLIKESNVWKLNCNQEAANIKTVDGGNSQFRFNCDGSNIILQERNITIVTNQPMKKAYYSKYFNEVFFFVSLVEENDVIGTLYGVKLGNLLSSDVLIDGKLILTAETIVDFDLPVSGIHFDTNTGNILVISVNSNGNRTVWLMVLQNTIGKTKTMTNTEKVSADCLSKDFFIENVEKITREIKTFTKSTVSSLRQSFGLQCKVENNLKTSSEVNYLNAILEGCRISLESYKNIGNVPELKILPIMTDRVDMETIPLIDIRTSINDD